MMNAERLVRADRIASLASLGLVAENADWDAWTDAELFRVETAAGLVWFTGVGDLDARHYEIDKAFAAKLEREVLKMKVEA